MRMGYAEGICSYAVLSFSFSSFKNETKKQAVKRQYNKRKMRIDSWNHRWWVQEWQRMPREARKGARALGCCACSSSSMSPFTLTLVTSLYACSIRLSYTGEVSVWVVLVAPCIYSRKNSMKSILSKLVASFKPPCVAFFKRKQATRMASIDLMLISF